MAMTVFSAWIRDFRRNSAVLFRTDVQSCRGADGQGCDSSCGTLGLLHTWADTSQHRCWSRHQKAGITGMITALLNNNGARGAAGTMVIFLFLS